MITDTTSSLKQIESLTARNAGKGSSRMSLQLGGYLLLLLALLCYAYVKMDVQFNWNCYAAFVLIIASTLPLLWFVIKRKDGVPLFGLNALYYGIGFGIGPLVYPRPEFIPDFSDETITLAVYLCLTGLVMQSLGYAIVQLRKSAVKKPIINLTLRPLSCSQILKLGWLLLIFAFIHNALSLREYMPALNQIARLSGLTGITLVFYGYNSLRGSGMYGRYLFFGCIIPFLIWDGIASGAVAHGMKYCALFLFVSLIVGQLKRALFWTLIAVFVLIVFNPIKHDFRREVWSGDDDAGKISFFERSSTMINLTIEHYMSSGNKFATSIGTANSRDSTFDRLNQLPYLLRVMRSTPSSVPYWEGSTFVSLPVMLIPRVFWPGKPSRGIANTFGRAYGILSPNDWKTSINTPWLIELYANNGFLFVAVGMGLIGIALGIIESDIVNVPSSGHSRIVSTGLFAGLIFPESDISTMWGGVVLGYTAVYFICHYAAVIVGPDRQN